MFEQIKKHIPKCINEKKRSAVLIPLIEIDNELHIVFEVRSQSLRHQPGEICFPGGRFEETDETTLETALRESCEELLIQKDSIQVLGALDYYLNPNGMRVDAYLGLLKNYSFTFNEEVQSIFTVPLSFFLNTKPDLYINTQIMVPDSNIPFESIPNGKDYKWAKGKMEVPFYYYKDKVIWGLTARLIYHNLSYLKPLD